MKKRFLLLAFILLSAFVMTACGGENVAPELVGVRDNVTIAQGDAFDPLAGITAADIEDGIITSSITYTGWTAGNEDIPGEYVITFSVTDSGDLTDTETMTVTVTDASGNAAPVLKDVSASVTITKGDAFDPLDGITADDAEDGDLTASITYTGWTAGNENVPGEYTIVFTVTDSGQLSDTATMTVTVEDDTVTEAIVENGDFETGEVAPFTKSDFEGAASTMEVVEDSGNHLLKLAITAVSWNQAAPRLEYHGLSLDSTKIYELSFDAYASVGRVMHAQVGEVLAADPWFNPAYDSTQYFTLTTEMQTFTWTFQVNESYGNADLSNLSLLLEFGTMANGGDSGIGDIFLDNIELNIVEELAGDTVAPIINLPSINSFYVGDQFEPLSLVSAYDNLDETVSIIVLEEESTMPAVDENDLFTTAGEYTVRFQAEDAAGNTSTADWAFEVKTEILAVNNFNLTNVLAGGEGDLDDSSTGYVWSQTEDAEFSYEDGELTIKSYQDADTDPWYATQLFVKSLPVETAGKYELTFDIVSDVAGTIKLQNSSYDLIVGTNSISYSMGLSAEEYAVLSIQFGTEETGNIGPFSIQINDLSLVLSDDPYNFFEGVGMTSVMDGTNCVISYENIPDPWYNYHAKTFFYDINYTADAIAFTLTGTEGQSYSLKYEGGANGTLSRSVDFIATGEEQVVLLDIRSLNDTQRDLMSKLVLSNKDVGASGSITIHSFSLVESLKDYFGTEWIGFGMDAVEEEEYTTISYNITSDTWWTVNAQSLLDEFDGTKDSIIFTFQGTEGHEYLFKVEGDGKYYEQSVIATGELQEFTLPLDSMTEEQRNTISTIAFFCKSTMVEGSVKMYGWDYSEEELPVWSAEGTFAVTETENTVEIVYTKNAGNWWEANAQARIEDFDGTKEAVTFTFTGVEGHEYLFKFEGSANREIAVVATGEEQSVDLVLSSMTEAQRDAIAKLVIFVKTGNVAGTLVFNGWEYQEEVGAEPLTTPFGVVVNETNMVWGALPEASSFEVYIDGVEGSPFTVAAGSYSFDFEPLALEPGTYSITIKAIGDGVNYADSALTSAFEYTIAGGSWTTEGDITVVENESSVDITYTNTSSSWWTSSAFGVIDSFDGTKQAVEFSFTGVAGHKYLFKLVNPDGKYSQISAIATGEAQTVVLPLTLLTEAQRSTINLVNIFQQTEGASGTLIYNGYTYYEGFVSSWIGEGSITVNESESTVEIMYDNISSVWWGSNAQTLVENFDGTQEAVTFTFTGEAGVEYLFKLEGTSGSKEVAVVASGTEETVDLYLSSMSESARSNINKLVIFVKTEGATGSMNFGGWDYMEVVGPLPFDTPFGLVINNNNMAWGAQSAAAGYKIYIDGVEGSPFSVSAGTYSFNLANLVLDPGTYSIQLQALGDGVNYADSALTTPISYTVAGSGTLVQVRTPFGVVVNTDNMVWGAIPEASSFEVYIDGVEGSPFTTTSPSFSFVDLNLAAGTYSIQLKALGDGETYSDSEMTGTYSYVVEEDTGEPEQLRTPFGVVVNTDNIVWGAISEASSFEVYIDGVEGSPFTTTSPSFSFVSLNLTAGTYNITIKAIGDGVDYTDSEMTGVYTYTVE